MFGSGSKAATIVVPPSSLYWLNTDLDGWTWQVDDFIKDNVFYEKDLSSLVPAGTTRVVLYIRIYNATTDGIMAWRKVGETRPNLITVIDFPGIAEHRYYQVSVDVSSELKIAYQLSPITYQWIDVAIVGGFKTV